MKKLTLSMLTVATLALIGCRGDGGSSSTPTDNGNTPPDDNYLTVPATYTLNGSNLPSCPNTYSIIKAQKENDFDIHQCLWLCASYEGASHTAVMLSFQQQGKNTP